MRDVLKHLSTDIGYTTSLGVIRVYTACGIWINEENSNRLTGHREEVTCAECKKKENIG